MKAGAQATPGETPMPRSARVISVLPEPARHQLGQRLRPPARRRARSARIVISLPHSAASIMTPMMLLPFTSMPSLASSISAAKLLASRTIRAAGPGMQSLLVHDGRLALDHRPTQRKKSSSAMASSAKRTLVSAGPNHRVTAAPTAATASAPTAPAQPKPRRLPARDHRDRQSRRWRRPRVRRARSRAESTTR